MRRSTVAHFARKVRGRILWRTSTENPTKPCPRALVMFATCPSPSLCEQSELQCCRPSHASKKFVNSCNSLLRRPRPSIKFVVFRRNHTPQRNSFNSLLRRPNPTPSFAVTASRPHKKKIGHPNGVPDSSLQINYIVDDLVPQSFANALMV